MVFCQAYIDVFVREMRKFQTKDATVAKLFAKHIKIQDSIKFLKSTRTGIAVGTPTRLKDLMDDGMDSSQLANRYLLTECCRCVTSGSIGEDSDRYFAYRCEEEGNSGDEGDSDAFNCLVAPERVHGEVWSQEWRHSIAVLLEWGFNLQLSSLAACVCFLSVSFRVLQATPSKECELAVASGKTQSNILSPATLLFLSQLLSGIAFSWKQELSKHHWCNFPISTLSFSSTST